MPHQYIGLQTIAQFREKEFACFPSCVEIWQAGFRSPRFKGSLTANILMLFASWNPCFFLVAFNPSIPLSPSGASSLGWDSHQLCHWIHDVSFSQSDMSSLLSKNHAACLPNTITISGNTLIVSLGYVSSNLGSSNQSHHHCSFW